MNYATFLWRMAEGRRKRRDDGRRHCRDPGAKPKLLAAEPQLFVADLRGSVRVLRGAIAKGGRSGDASGLVVLGLGWMAEEAGRRDRVRSWREPAAPR